MNLAKVSEHNPGAQAGMPNYYGGALKSLPRFDLANLDGAPPPPREWLLRDLWPKNEVTLFTGPGGAGKSLGAQQASTCLASGVPFLGIPVERKRALYITAEDDETELHRRQRNIMAALGIGASDLGDRLFLSSVRGHASNELVTFDRDGEMQKTERFKQLRDTVADFKPDAIVLDNLAHLFGGNENDRSQVTRFVNAIYSLPREVAREYRIDVQPAVLLVGHPNKSGDAYSGSTAWLNAVRSQIEIARVADEHGNVLDPDARTIKLGKANYARHGQVLEFRWHNFAFTVEADLPRDVRAEIAATARIAAENTAFLDCLKARNAQGEGRQVGPSPGPNYAPAQFVGMREAKGLKKPALKAAMDRLFAIGEIETHTYRNTTKSRDVTIIREVSQ